MAEHHHVRNSGLRNSTNILFIYVERPQSHGRSQEAQVSPSTKTTGGDLPRTRGPYDTGSVQWYRGALLHRDFVGNLSEIDSGDSNVAVQCGYYTQINGVNTRSSHSLSDKDTLWPGAPSVNELAWSQI